MSRPKELEVALNLMRLALPLLDRAGEYAAAARLQHAIDTAEREPTGALDEAALDRLLHPTAPAATHARAVANG